MLTSACMHEVGCKHSSLLNCLLGRPVRGSLLPCQKLMEREDVQGKVVQALRSAQQHQLKTIRPEMFLDKAVEAGLQYVTAVETSVLLPHLWCRSFWAKDSVL